jgi:hypothetical protein
MRSDSSERELLDRLGVARHPSLVRHDEHPLRSRILDFVKTFVWVAPLTALIWVYAEREQWATLYEVPVTIKVRSSVPDRVITMPRSPDRIYLELRGPREGLDAVRNGLLDPRNEQLNVDIPASFEPGFKGEMSIADWIGRNELFRRGAVTVVRASPPTIAINVEAKVTATAKVVIAPAQKGQIVGACLFQPETVTIEGPKSVIDELTADQLIVHADMSRFLNRTPGRYEGNVPLAFPRSDITVRAGEAHATVVIESARTTTLQPIPVIIRINGAALAEDQYRFHLNRYTLDGVAVSGSVAAIEALDRAWKDGTFMPAAIVRINKEELDNPGEYIKRLTANDYDMPRDVTVATQEKEITLTIERR